jgi:hypothetical protein
MKRIIMDQDKATQALELLKSFNRKERYHLLVDAVTDRAFQLTGQFRDQLNRVLSDNGPAYPPLPERPSDVYVAMDYHLDWIAAAVSLVERPDAAGLGALQYASSTKATTETGPYPNSISKTQDATVITGNQQDTDLMVAFVSEGCLHLILIEAKIESGWEGGQLKNKGARLEEIFGAQGDAFDFVKVRFVLAGPNAAERSPNYSKPTLDVLPTFFFKDGDANRKENLKARREGLYRINLSAKPALYQPTRLKEPKQLEDQKEPDWVVLNTYSPEDPSEPK